MTVDSEIYSIFPIFQRVFGILQKNSQNMSYLIDWFTYNKIDVLTSSVCREEHFLDISLKKSSNRSHLHN